MDNKLNSILEAAIILAAEAHMGQRTWDDQPYILHPFHLMDQADDILIKILCVLHDVNEDTVVDLAHINSALTAAGQKEADKRFVDGIMLTIMKALELLSHDKAKQTYEEYIEGICTNRHAMQVKLLDLSHNMDVTRSYEIPKKFAAYIAAHQKISKELKRISA